MADGLTRTFELLAETENEAANRVLLAALDSPHASVRRSALASILARRSLAGFRAVVARFHEFDDDCRAIVAGNARRLTLALREAVTGSDRQTCFNACEAARTFREYDLAPALLHALEDAANPNADLAGATLLDLVDLLCGEFASKQEDCERRDPEMIRQQVLRAIEGSAERFAKHRQKVVLDALLRLASHDNQTLRKLLTSPLDAAFRVLTEMLAGRSDPGTTRMLLSFLDDPRAPSAVLNTIGKRADLPFVEQLLRKVGSQPSDAIAHNLKRIETIAWIRDREFGMLLAELDESLQHSAVQLVMISGVPRPQAFAVVERVLLAGKPEGRRAAAAALESFQGAQANHLALVALDDQDAEVQAVLLPQLRRRSIPGAVGRLVAMLDSPHPVVRKAARESLSEFTLASFLKNYDMLSDDARQSTGELIKKVDQRLIPQLRAELTSRSRTRRLRGLEIARLLGVVRQAESAVLSLLHDEDHMIRAAAAQSLGLCRSRVSRNELLESLSDRSVIVQEAAARSLEQRGEPLPQQFSLLPLRDPHKSP